MKTGCARRRLNRRTPWLAALCAVLLGVWGCAKDYDDPDAEYYSGDATAQSLVDPATVNRWVTNDLKTDNGQRVVILDCTPNPDGIFPYSDTESWFAGNADKIRTNMAAQYGGESAPQYKMIAGLEAGGLLGHIPGALPNVAHEGYEVTPRNDGPMVAEHEVGTGDLIGQMLCRLGVRKDDLVVLTTSRYDYPGFCPARMYWTLRYWGFSRNNLKVLDGGNKAYAMAGYPLAAGVVTLANVTPSNFEVTDLPRRFFGERISVGELIDLVDSGRTSLADDDPDKVIVLDARQPPVAYYFADGDTSGTADLFETPGYTAAMAAGLTLSEYLFTDAAGLQIPFSATTNPPINPADSGGLIGLHKLGAGPLAIPLGAKPAAFEAVVKGAKVVKSSTYNITIPAISQADGRYKAKADLLPLFAAAGIDGTKPIVTYCNSGALAAIYYYVFREICEFPDVRLYDGSWNEWANLAAYEPADSTYVLTDSVSAYPMYPKGSPKVAFFKGFNSYFNWDAAAGTFVDAVTGDAISTEIVPGGPLDGQTAWDTVHRSERVVFRATAATAVPGLKSYKPGVNWPSVETYPDYQGSGSEIWLEDEAYQGAAATSGGSSGPSPFIPVGGGC